MIQQLFGRWLGEADRAAQLTVEEKEIVRLAVSTTKPITPSDVSERLGVCRRTAQKLMYQLVDKQVFSKSSGSKRIRSYQLNPNRWENEL